MTDDKPVQTSRVLANFAYIFVCVAIVAAVAFVGGYAVGQRGPLVEVGGLGESYNATACTVPATCTLNISLTNSNLTWASDAAGPCVQQNDGRTTAFRCTFVADNTTWVCNSGRGSEGCDTFTKEGPSDG